MRYILLLLFGCFLAVWVGGMVASFKLMGVLGRLRDEGKIPPRSPGSQLDLLFGKYDQVPEVRAARAATGRLLFRSFLVVFVPWTAFLLARWLLGP